MLQNLEAEASGQDVKVAFSHLLFLWSPIVGLFRQDLGVFQWSMWALVLQAGFQNLSGSTCLYTGVALLLRTCFTSRFRADILVVFSLSYALSLKTLTALQLRGIRLREVKYG